MHAIFAGETFVENSCRQSVGIWNAHLCCPSHTFRERQPTKEKPMDALVILGLLAHESPLKSLEHRLNKPQDKDGWRKLEEPRLQLFESWQALGVKSLPQFCCMFLLFPKVLQLFYRWGLPCPQAVLRVRQLSSYLILKPAGPPRKHWGFLESHIGISIVSWAWEPTKSRERPMFFPQSSGLLGLGLLENRRLPKKPWIHFYSLIGLGTNEIHRKP